MRRTNPDSLRSCFCFHVFRLNFNCYRLGYKKKVGQLYYSVIFNHCAAVHLC